MYVGSTTQPLYKINDWYIELYEDFQAETKEQLNKREGEIIREIATLNKRIEGRTPKEWIVTNKNKLKQYNKDYYETNKEKTLKKTIF